MNQEIEQLERSANDALANAKNQLAGGDYEEARHWSVQASILLRRLDLIKLQEAQERQYDRK